MSLIVNVRITDIELLTTEKFPSSGSFDLIASALSDESERKDAIKKSGAIFAFTLKNSNGETAEWHIDLKESGNVAKGLAPEGKKANGMDLEPILSRPSARRREGGSIDVEQHTD